MNRQIIRLLLRRTIYRIGAASAIGIMALSSAYSDTRIKVNCSLDEYSPRGRYTERNLRVWLPDKFRIELSNQGDVSVYIRSGPTAGSRFQGEVRRENSEKIGMEATQKASDSRGRKTFLTYKLDLFKSSNKLAVSAIPQGYAPLGRARGTCVDAKSSTSTPGRHRVELGAIDTRVCAMATRYGEWQGHQSFELWVEEAQKRGMSLSDCEKLLKAK